MINFYQKIIGCTGQDQLDHCSSRPLCVCNEQTHWSSLPLSLTTFVFAVTVIVVIDTDLVDVFIVVHLFRGSRFCIYLFIFFRVCAKVQTLLLLYRVFPSLFLFLATCFCPCLCKYMKQ